MRLRGQVDVPDVPIRYYEETAMFMWTQCGFTHHMCWEIFSQATDRIISVNREMAYRMILDQLCIQHGCTVDYEQILGHWRGSATPLA